MRVGIVCIFLWDRAKNLIGFMNWIVHLSMAPCESNTIQTKLYGEEKKKFMGLLFVAQKLGFEFDLDRFLENTS